VRELSCWADLDGPTHYVELREPDQLAPGAEQPGPPLVLVHGLAGASANWMAIAPTLAATGRRVLALDLPGHGLTRPAGRDSSVDGLVEVVRRFVDEVAGGPSVLVGNSLGGLLCLEQAARHPDSVVALALLAPAVPTGRARMHPITVAGFAGYAVPGLGELLVSGRRRRWTPEQLVAQSLWMCCADPSRVPADLVRRHVELVRRRAGYRRLDDAFLTTARTLLRRLARPRRLRARLDAVRCPVLLVHGTRDRLVPVAAARAVARAHPSWRYEEVPDVGHVPQMEVPEQTADLLAQWMADVEQRRLFTDRIAG
jgi:pimeloyl-ACP methyl ester carboxylesterase